VLQLIRAAVAAQVDLIQIREKNLNASVLYELAARAADLTRKNSTSLLINDRSDLAAAAGADGVHLTTSSLPPDVVRRTFGERFLIGASTHSAEEAISARRDGADFVVFGPVFETASKREYGEAVGLARLTEVSTALSPFPVLALGGVTTANVADCLQAGAQGVAGISMFAEPEKLSDVVEQIRRAAFARGQA
jgi:thiamine-phosphate pyrophosphorylase